MKRIYLDYASSAPTDKKVLKEMMPYLKKEFGNASSLHAFGQHARAAIEKAREQVGSFLNCAPLEIVFTSGATEANNLAIFGVGHARVQPLQKFHIVTTQIEHESVLSPCQELERLGLAEVTYLPVDAEGIVKVEDVEKAIKDNTVLVSVMYANSEIGTIQPIAEIGAMIKKLSAQDGSASGRKTLFHVDAVQAAQFLDCDVQKIGADLLTLSSHKVYGPKGAGALYVKEGTMLDPLLFGGGQEQGFRSGTENVASIAGMGAAFQEIQSPRTHLTNIKIRQLRDKIIKGVLMRVKGSVLSGSSQKRLANNAHFRFEGIAGQELAVLLDQKGIAVSTGSACSEKTQEPSHVLLALGVSGGEAMQSVRITLGKYTTLEEVEKALKVLVGAVDKLRGSKIS